MQPTHHLDRRLEDEREIIYAILVDPRHTTAETGLAPEDFCEPAHADIWRAIIELEDALSPREIADVVRVLKRHGRYDRRAIRQVLESDPTIPLIHWAWTCAELRERAAEARRIREAIQILDKYNR